MKKLLSLLFGACGLLYGVPSQAEVMCCPENQQCGDVCCPTKGCNADRTACATEECASGIIDDNGYCCGGYLLDGACVNSCPSGYGAYNGYCRSCSDMGTGYGAYNGDCRYCPDMGSGYGIYNGDCRYCSYMGSGYGAYDGYCRYCPDIGSGYGAYNGMCVNCSDYGYSVENGYCAPARCPALLTNCEDENCPTTGPMDVDGEITQECCTAFGGHFLYGESFLSTGDSCKYESSIPLCCFDDGNTWLKGEEESYTHSFWNPYLQVQMIPTGCLQVQSDSVKEEVCISAFGPQGEFYSNYTANECKSYFERKYNADIRIETYYNERSCYQNGYSYCLCSGDSVYVRGTNNPSVSQDCANVCASTAAANSCPSGFVSGYNSGTCCGDGYGYASYIGTYYDEYNGYWSTPYFRPEMCGCPRSDCGFTLDGQYCHNRGYAYIYYDGENFQVLDPEPNHGAGRLCPDFDGYDHVWNPNTGDEAKNYHCCYTAGSQPFRASISYSNENVMDAACYVFEPYLTIYPWCCPQGYAFYADGSRCVPTSKCASVDDVFCQGYDG